MKNWRKGIIRKFHGGKKKDYGEFIQLLNKNILDLEYDGAKEMVIPAREELIEYGKKVKGEFIPTVHEEGFENILEFDNPNAGFGRVIEYEGEYYYIYLHQNYNMKNFDGFVLHKLGERAKEETLNICYWPKKYVWKNYYESEQKKELEEYIEGIKEEITSEKYLENGKAKNIGVYVGKESQDPDFPVEDWKRYRKIDLANIGIPVYMKRGNFIPSNYWNTWHLTVEFYMEDPMRESIRELEEMKVGEYFPILVQMWFEEFGGKVLTFQVYHYTDYNYMLHVLMAEGDKVTQVRTDIFSPERSFIVTEGEIFNGGI